MDRVPAHADPFRAIADPTRRAIIDRLRKGPRAVNSLAADFAQSRPAISRHLRVLREAAVITEEKSGRERLYRLRSQALREVVEWVEGYRGFWRSKLTNLEHHLVGRFITNGNSAKAIADVSGGVILAEVELAAPPERVFKALTRSDEVLRWWGSDDAYRTESFEADLRKGGAWKSGGRDSAGAPYSVKGVFLEVDPPRHLVQTWNADWDDAPETTLTYQLTNTDIGTRLTLRHEGFAGAAESCQMQSFGWQAVLGWLSKHLTPKAASTTKDPDRFYMVRLLPPRPSFVQDMTPEEAAVMQEHTAFWTEHLRHGKAIIFGPVADPKGSWGLGVVRVADDEQMRAYEKDDPAIRSGRGFRYEVLPMIRAVTAS